MVHSNSIFIFIACLICITIGFPLSNFAKARASLLKGSKILETNGGSISRVKHISNEIEFNDYLKNAGDNLVVGR